MVVCSGILNGVGNGTGTSSAAPSAALVVHLCCCSRLMNDNGLNEPLSH